MQWIGSATSNLAWRRNYSGKGLAWRRAASSCNAFAIATFSGYQMINRRICRVRVI